MFRVKKDIEYSIEINRSKFICYLGRVFSEEEAKQFIYTLKKQHPNANHHCYAFIIGKYNEIQRSNDDGEPSGTAGVPILECLKNNQMSDTIAVVVRYFGGIKLGAGGLIRAYSKSVSETIKLATLMLTCNVHVYSITFTYSLIGKFDYFFQQQNVTIIEKKYDEFVTYIFYHQTNLDEQCSALTNGESIPIFLYDKMIEIER